LTDVIFTSVVSTDYIFTSVVWTDVGQYQQLSSSEPGSKSKPATTKIPESTANTSGHPWPSRLVMDSISFLRLGRDGQENGSLSQFHGVLHHNQLILQQASSSSSASDSESDQGSDSDSYLAAMSHASEGGGNTQQTHRQLRTVISLRV
jgi:hypothetical protein